MTSMDAAETSRPPNSSLTGSYVLRHLLDNIPLSAEGNDKSIEITCVEFWGTSGLESFWVRKLI